MDLRYLDRIFLSIETNENTIKNARILNQSYYVAIKDYFYHPEDQSNELNAHNMIYLARLFIIGWMKVWKRNAAKNIVFSADSGLYRNPAGAIKDKFVDLLNIDKFNHFIAIGSFRNRFRIRDLNRNNIISDNILFIPFIIALKFIVYLRISFIHDINEKYKYFHDYGLFGSILEFKKLIARNHAKFLCYFLLIKWFEADRVYVVSAPGKSYIINAAKRANAETFEIQHGECGPYHRGYNYRCKFGDIATPQMLIVRSSYWFNEAQKGGYFPPEKIIIGKQEPATCTTCLNLDWPESLKQAKNNPYILFTSQPPVGQIIIEQIRGIYRELEKRGIYFVYKCHPAESEKRIEEIEKFAQNRPYIVIIKNNECLDCLLRKSIAHVSFWSTCHHDAVNALGKTYVLFKDGIHYFDQYCKNDPTRFVAVRDMQELLTSIK